MIVILIIFIIGLIALVILQGCRIEQLKKELQEAQKFDAAMTEMIDQYRSGWKELGKQ